MAGQGGWKGGDRKGWMEEGREVGMEGMEGREGWVEGVEGRR
jgi:hypothetical protein